MDNEILDLQENNAHFLNRSSYIVDAKRNFALKTFKWMEPFAPRVFACDEFVVFKQEVRFLQHTLANLKSGKEKANKKTKELVALADEVIGLWSPA
jgi:hypothetical protein